jgi:small subunit ribosomal protein S1
LTEEYDYKRPRRGEIRHGEVVKIEDYGVLVDVGLKRDGFVSRSDLERLGEDTAARLKPGQEIVACVVNPRDRNGELILSMFQARQEKDWGKAEELLDSGAVWQGEVADFNRGGLLVQFGHIRGFVPMSHLWERQPGNLSEEQRMARLEEYMGQELAVKVIEVQRRRRRLVMSERLAQGELQDQHMDRLLNDLLEGMVCPGRVTRLASFGTFVDLGGAEGLIHISELAWQHIRHPREAVKVGDEIDVYILRLDHDRKRIGLSLKRLEPDPWSVIDEEYAVDQLVSGTVTNVVDFGAFVALPVGVEGLLHVTEIADPAPSHPGDRVGSGDELVLRVLSIDPMRQRIALSLKEVSEQESQEWLARQSEPPVESTTQPQLRVESAAQPELIEVV